MEKKRIIWQNIDLNIDDWREGYNEYCEINDIPPGDDGELYDWMVDTNNEYLDDERVNLRRLIDGCIVIFCDIGVWNGRRRGVKLTRSNDLSTVLDIPIELGEIYADGEDIRATTHHHDGANYYLFRVIRDDRDTGELMAAIYDGDEITPEMMDYYTRSIYPDIASVYGW